MSAGEGNIEYVYLLNVYFTNMTDRNTAKGIRERFTGVNDFAVTNGFASGFPNLHETDYGNGLVYGTILLQPGTNEWRDVPASVLGTSDRDTAVGIRKRFTAVYDYAITNGFVGGFPNLHEADYGN